MADAPELTLREALSGISGSISIAAWIFLLLPQLWENYRNQSADALSVAFLIVWFLGDATNLAGAVWDGLLPGVIAIAIYFCCIDFALIAQTFYYKLRAYRGRSKQHGDSTGDRSDPTQPLLGDHGTHAASPQLRQRPSVSSRRRSSAAHSLPYINDEEQSQARRWARNLTAVLGVGLMGALAWTVCWKVGWWQPTAPDEEGDAERILGAEILGYASAVLYLGARLPQIWKNYQEKSCEGLSLLFFMLSTLGNITYGTQILFHSTSANYVVKTLPWLIGSLGTIAEDVIIFVQFQLYARKSESTAVID